MKQISPGGEAKINVKVSTKGYGGRKITETVSIYTNDEKQPRLSVTMTGFVEKFSEIIPPRALLTGPVGKPLTAQIRIIPKDRFPFKIVNARAKNGEFIKFHLQERKESGKSFYVLIIENIRQKKGRYSDVIYLEPDNKSLPLIQIYAIGNILEKEPDSGNNP